MTIANIFYIFYVGYYSNIFEMAFHICYFFNLISSINFLKFMFVCVFVCRYVCESKNLVGVCSSFKLGESWGLNSGPWACWQEPLSAEPACLPISSNLTGICGDYHSQIFQIKIFALIFNRKTPNQTNPRGFKL